MQYRYTGPGPIEAPTPDGLVLIHPGDVWEFPEEPAFGPWEPVDPDGSEIAAAAPATPAPAAAPETAPPAESAPPSTEGA